MAWNCSIVLTAMRGDAGVRARFVSFASITERDAVPITPLSAAVIFASHFTEPVAFPALSIAATAAFEVLHVTCAVISLSEPSE